MIWIQQAQSYKHECLLRDRMRNLASLAGFETDEWGKGLDAGFVDVFRSFAARFSYSLLVVWLLESIVNILLQQLVGGSTCSQCCTTARHDRVCGRNFIAWEEAFSRRPGCSFPNSPWTSE